MDATLKPFQQLMASARRFQIPEYQRPYCWTMEEAEQLWNDLSGAYEDYLAKACPSQGEEYFLGPLVVANEKETKGTVIAHVVDGQQRLTTLHSFIWCAYRKFSTSEGDVSREKKAELDRLLLTAKAETTLSVAREDQANFLALREGTPLDEKRTLGAVGQFLREKVESFPSTEAMAGFLDYLQNQVNFVYVETENFSAAWDLFIGLNGKGRPLTPADLIKAFVCGTSDDSQAMADIWKDKVLPLENNSTSAILEVVRVATGETSSDAKLFKSFERAWTAKQVTAPLLAAGASLYNDLWLVPFTKISSLSSMSKRRLRGLRSLGRRDHTSAMIALGSIFGSNAVVNPNLLAAIESFQLWMAVRGLRGRERQFTELAHQIYRSDYTLEDAFGALQSLLKKMSPSIQEVHNGIKQLRYPGRIMKYVALQYEEGMRGDVEVGDVTYEHMMPQEPTDYWYQAVGHQDRHIYDQLIGGIGNMVPLDANTNIVGSNGDWPTKCSLYEKNVPLWTAAAIARANPDNWTADKIHKRASDIAEWAVAVRWNLPLDIEHLVP